MVLKEGSQVERLDNNKVDPNGPKAMIGAGTGLGHGYIVKTTEGLYHEVFPSEGGHSDYAPQTELEWDYFKFVM
jgi:glucokinase